MDKTHSTAPTKQPGLTATPQVAKHPVVIDSAWQHDFQLSSQRFDDALFADEKALDEALERRRQQQPAKTPRAQVTKKAQQKAQAASITPDIDFSQFLTASSKAGQFEPDEAPAPRFTVCVDENSPAIDSPCNVPNEVSQPSIVNITGTETSKALVQNTQQTAVDKRAWLLHILNSIKACSISYKAQLDEYFGRSLPQRELALELPLPSLKPKSAVAPIVTSRDIKRLFSYKAASLLSVFKQAETDLGKLANCRISSTNKLHLLNNYTEPLAVRVHTLISALQRKPITGNDHKRQQTTLYAIGAVKHLLTGYKHIYAALYESSNWLYGPKRKTINQCAYRLIDLLCLEQYLYEAMHRALPTASIKVLNKLYSALSLYEPQLLNEALDSLTLKSKTSINELFKRYQLLLCFDLMSIGTSQHPLVYRYLQQHVDTVLIQSGSQCLTINEPWLYIPHDGSRAPILVNSLNKLYHPSTIIWAKQFFTQIKKDYCEALTLTGSRNDTHSCNALQCVNTHEVLSILSTLNSSVERLENQNPLPNYRVYQATQWQAYVGIKQTQEYCRYHYNKQTSSQSSQNESERPTLVKPTFKKSVWLSAMEDDNHLYLQTLLDKTELSFDIGNIVLFVKYSEQCEQLQLASILRMERVQENKLNLVLLKLGDKLTNISFTDNRQTQHDAIIAVYKQNHYLIKTASTALPTSKLLAVTFNDQSSATVCLKNLTAVSRYFQALKLR